MNPYMDKQSEAQLFFPQNECAERNVIGHLMEDLYAEAQRAGQEAWLVLATSGELKFVYPVLASKGKTGRDAARDAEQQHHFFARPEITEPVVCMRVTGEMVAERRRKPTEQTSDARNLCDFCGLLVTSHRTEHPCENFLLVDGSTSVGAWLGCESCNRFIEADDQQGLIERQISRCLEAHPRESFDMKDLRRLYAQNTRNFFQHRHKKI